MKPCRPLLLVLLGVAINLAMGLPQASPARAAATPISDQQAADAYQEGRALYAAGHFARAAERFTVAYDHFHDTNILWNVGRSLEQAGEYEAARQRYTELLAKDDVSAQIRVDAGEALGRVGAKLAARKAATTPSLRRALLTQELTEANSAGNAELASKLEAELAALPPEARGGDEDATGGDATEHRAAGSDSRTDTAEPRDADGVKLPEGPAPEPAGGSTAGWIVGGGGIALVAGGVALYLVGQDKHNQVDDATRQTDRGVVHTMTRAQALALSDEGTTFKTLGAIGLGLGSAAVATGALLLLLDDTAPEGQGSVHVAAQPLPGGFGLGLSGTY